MTVHKTNGREIARRSDELAVSQVATRLARVEADSPAAVLLVDLAAGTVVYANALARQLAPGVALPVDVTEWSERAGLRDEHGEPLEGTITPLARVASGEPVNGELVTAMRGSSATEAREDLWVIGTPLVDAPGPLGLQALVVLLPLREEAAIADLQAGAQQNGPDLRHRAVLASETSFSISDPTQPDNPLVWVNPAFERTTGYRSDDVLGLNCRFLQGPLTDATSVARIAAHLTEDAVVNETLLNYRADGTAFWNHLVISPVFDADGQLTHHVGVQTDVTVRVEADLARNAALVLAEQATARQRAVSSISAELSEQVARPDDFVQRVPSLVAAYLEGLTAIVVLGADGRVQDLAAAVNMTAGSGGAAFVDVEDARQALLDFFATEGRDVLAATSSSAARWPVIVYVPQLDALVGRSGRGAAPVKAVIAALPVRGRVAGLLLVARAGDRFDDFDEAAAIADIGLRVGTTLDNTRLFAAERDTALTLQRSLLPSLPTTPRFDIAASYVPAADAEVGGDWFDVLELPGPWIGVTIGDVIGHDMAAAAAMGQLRAMIRTLAWEGHEPAELVTRADALVRSTGTTSFATMLYARIDDPDEIDAARGSECEVLYACAGHPPAMLRHPNGRVERLDGAITSPVGVADPRPVLTGRTELPVGGTLVLYTDGLVERRIDDIDSQLDRLENLLTELDAGTSAQQIRDRITDALIDVEHFDDTCLLVLRRRF